MRYDMQMGRVRASRPSYHDGFEFRLAEPRVFSSFPVNVERSYDRPHYRKPKIGFGGVRAIHDYLVCMLGVVIKADSEFECYSVARSMFKTSGLTVRDFADWLALFEQYPMRRQDGTWRLCFHENEAFKEYDKAEIGRTMKAIAERQQPLGERVVRSIAEIDAMIEESDDPVEALFPDPAHFTATSVKRDVHGQ